MSCYFLILLLISFHDLIIALDVNITTTAACPIINHTNIVYSTVSGVGSASKIWVQDLLWWWKTYDSSIHYVELSSSDLQTHCDLSSFPNLRLYINPGGDAYNQLTSLGTSGTSNIKKFISRSQVNPSAYLGFCAGAYVAAHSYLWETMYEGPGYYNYATNPPLSIFPHMVEGSLVDINDDQYGDQFGSKFRLVNVSNGHQMLYYGGSSFGYNGADPIHDPESKSYDPNLEVLLYYTDFYGFYSKNVPAAWKYNNVLMTSIHPEADNCTSSQDSDCPPANTIPINNILQNRAWITTYINQVAQTNFKIPDVPIPPVFDTTPPHTTYPIKDCDSSGVLFCDDFDALGRVPEGLSPRFQRNQTDYDHSQPWNTSYISTWNKITYTTPHQGNGYAIVIPNGLKQYSSSIITKPFDTSSCSSSRESSNLFSDGIFDSSIAVTYAYKGQTTSNGYIRFLYSIDGITYTTVSSVVLNPAVTTWKEVSFSIPTAKAVSVTLMFMCDSGAASTGDFCALDTLSVSCATK